MILGLLLLLPVVTLCVDVQRPLDYGTATGEIHLLDDLYPEASWPSNQPGESYTAQLPDIELTSMIFEIDPLRIQSIIEKLVSFGTRHTLSSQRDPKRGIGAARDWILSEFSKYAEISDGSMEVEVLTYLQGVRERVDKPTNVSSVCATLRGSSDPEKIVVVR